MDDTMDRRAVLAGLATSLVTIRPVRADPAEPPQPITVWRAAPVARRFAAEAPEDAQTWSLDPAGADPVLRVRHGEEAALRLVNDTPLPLSLHWYGVRGPNGMDGVGGLTQPPVPPGGSFEYRFTPPDPGTFLARPFVLGRSGEPAGRGLAGLLIVDERAPPKVEADLALVVRDWRLEPSGALAPFGAAMEAALAGRLGNRITVSGEAAPKRVAFAPGARVRLRLVNGCNARIARVQFERLKVTVAAVDGQPSETFEPLRSALPFPPGTRYDLFVDLPLEADATGQVTALVGNGVPLLEIATKAADAAAPPPPRPAGAGLAPNPLLPAEIRLQNAVRRDLVIAGGATKGPSGEPVYGGDPKAVWTLGGKAGALQGPPVLSARRGQPVVIGLHNQTAFPQPIHIHGHVVRLLHPLDDGWEPYWLDTIQVAEGRTARVAFIADNPGRWLLGSTVLERLDTGLWGWFEVTG